MDLSKVFDQYLRTMKIPVFEYKLEGEAMKYRYTNVIDGFQMPLRVFVGEKPHWLYPTTEWKTETLKATADNFKVDPNFYVQHKGL